MTCAGCGHCWGTGRGPAGHHQDTARVTRQLGSAPHAACSSVALPAQPHTLQEPSPTLPSHCCRCVGSRNLITEQQGAQQSWGQGCLQASLLWALSDGTAHTFLAPNHAQRSSALGLDRHRPCSAESMASTLPSFSQPTPQAVDIKDMQHINKNSWNF